MPGQPVVLETMGGLVATARPEDIPEGASPRTWDTDFIVGRVIQRAGLSNDYSYSGVTFGPNGAGNATSVGGTSWNNANAFIKLDASRPLGATGLGATWSDFQIPPGN